MNTIIDERGSLSICSSIPGPLLGLLKSIRKLPARVALSGDVVRLKDKKIQVVVDSIKESILLEHKVASQASYTSSAVLSSAGISCRSRSEIFQEILNEIGSYNIYKFDIGSCTYIDGSGSIYDVELDNFKAPTADLLLPFSGKLIDGINQSQTRRRALMLFCFEYHNVTPRVMLDFQAAERQRLEEPASEVGLEALCAMINNNLRCYELSTELSNSTMEALPQNYAEQMFQSLAKEESTSALKEPSPSTARLGG